MVVYIYAFVAATLRALLFVTATTANGTDYLPFLDVGENAVELVQSDDGASEAIFIPQGFPMMDGSSPDTVYVLLLYITLLITVLAVLEWLHSAITPLKSRLPEIQQKRRHELRMCGGGPKRMQEKINAFFPFKLATFDQVQPVTNVDFLDKVPFLNQCREAISTLHNHVPKHPSKFLYISFPFGLLDENGLRQLIRMHEKAQEKKRIQQEKKWLGKDALRPIPNGSVQQDKLIDYFAKNIWVNQPSKSVIVSCLRNLVGNNWLTDTVLSTIAHIMNKDSGTLCFVLQHPALLFSDEGMQQKLERIRLKNDLVQKVFIFLNIGRNYQGETHVALQGGAGGCHWTLLFFEAGSSKWHYGDSLAWPFPSETDPIVSTLRRIERNTGATLIGQNIQCQVMHNPTSTNSKHSHVCKGQCSLLYPLQTCSTVCGVIVVVMAAVLSRNRSIWPDKSNCMTEELKWILKPSTFSDYLRKIIMQWILTETLDVVMLAHTTECITNTSTCGDNYVPEDEPEKSPFTGDNDVPEDEPEKSLFIEKNTPDTPQISPTTPACKENGILYSRIPSNQEPHSSTEEMDSEPYSDRDPGPDSDQDSDRDPGPDSDSDFDRDLGPDSDPDSDPDIWGTKLVRNLLPQEYEYKFQVCRKGEREGGFDAEFLIGVHTERDVKKWVEAYNSCTKETMVFGRKKKGRGVHITTKYFLHCHHRQRQTGKHTKVGKTLKTTIKEHAQRHTDCPARLTLSVLSTGSKTFGVSAKLFHNHNHPVEAADALRFRRISEDTKSHYYDLFKLGHSPASAHLEYETNLMLANTTLQVLADRSINPKRKDIYNLFSKWRKENLGIKDGKEMYDELERRIVQYNEENAAAGGKATLLRYKKSSDGTEEPLVMAICTPLMSRAHSLIPQAAELSYIDSTASLDDFNNPVYVASTSCAAGGVPLGVVVTSGESTQVITKAMSTLKTTFPDNAFYGRGGELGPQAIITDDCTAEKDGLRAIWPQALQYLCIFHVLQSVWRWLGDSHHSIRKEHRQTLMELFRKLVYGQSPEDVDYEYFYFKTHPLVIAYKNYARYIEHLWHRKHEWSVGYRDNGLMRGNHTNNYSETGIRILKDIIFSRIRAYNLIQIFEFITVTFEMYYQSRLLAIAHNRIDRYISLRFKGLGGDLYKPDDIRTSDNNTFTVKSHKHQDLTYTVNLSRGICTCTLGFNGQPTGEPCRHQAAVAKIYKLHGPNTLPTFSVDGRYHFATIAVGKSAGPKSFYAGLHDHTDDDKTPEDINDTPEGDGQSDICSDREDSGSQNSDLDLLLDMMDAAEKQEEAVYSQAKTLTERFMEDVTTRLEAKDKNYMTGLTHFLKGYLGIVDKAEQITSATPKLSSYLHTCHKPDCIPRAGSRRINVQPTALQRRRKELPRGSKKAPQGRPAKRKWPDDDDDFVQPKRGKESHTKRKQNLRLNEKLNQPNQSKH